MEISKVEDIPCQISDLYRKYSLCSLSLNEFPDMEISQKPVNNNQFPMLKVVKKYTIYIIQNIIINSSKFCRFSMIGVNPTTITFNLLENYIKDQVISNSEDKKSDDLKHLEQEIKKEINDLKSSLQCIQNGVDENIAVTIELLMKDYNKAINLLFGPPGLQTGDYKSTSMNLLLSFLDSRLINLDERYLEAYLSAISLYVSTALEKDRSKETIKFIRDKLDNFCLNLKNCMDSKYGHNVSDNIFPNWTSTTLDVNIKQPDAVKHFSVLVNSLETKSIKYFKFEKKVKISQDSFAEEPEILAYVCNQLQLQMPGTWESTDLDNTVRVIIKFNQKPNITDLILHPGWLNFLNNAGDVESIFYKPLLYGIQGVKMIKELKNKERHNQWAHQTNDKTDICYFTNKGYKITPVKHSNLFSHLICQTVKELCRHYQLLYNLTQEHPAIDNSQIIFTIFEKEVTFQEELAGLKKCISGKFEEYRLLKSEYERQ
ncbi:12633_t:CDS:1 [Cetraspora pellucida]|uniref:12633_t:CDS:1 n=1 Tax=Cetraspora pellucida TaxID=1433469 RepID=A0ACA9MZU7_9GLOM|nr:12633_t:CDS:1 [Cetraspora pellucida]